MTADKMAREEARRAKRLEGIRYGRTCPEPGQGARERPAWMNDRSLLPKRPPGVSRG